MSALRVLLSRFSALFRGRERDRDLDDEIAGHLGEAVDEYIARGLSAADARAAALRDFGGVTQTKHVHREMRAFTWPENVQQDLRYSWRRLRGLQRLR